MAKKNDLNDDNSERIDNNDDTFGLPEIEYSPLNREERKLENEDNTTSERSEEPVEKEEIENQYEYGNEVDQSEAEESQLEEESAQEIDDDDEERPSILPKVFGIVIFLLVAAGVYWFFGIYQPKQKAAEEARLREEANRAALLEAREKARLDSLASVAEAQRVADSIANAKPAIGAIVKLSERTGKFYVVVASSIDGDLIMDEAQRLSPKGVSSKIIPPFGKNKFYRLAVAEGDSYGDAQAIADGLKEQYEGKAWVLKY